MDLEKLIKTDCGKQKYIELSQRKGIIAKLRFYWFIIFAVIEDWNLPESDHIKRSES